MLRLPVKVIPWTAIPENTETLCVVSDGLQAVKDISSKNYDALIQQSHIDKTVESEGTLIPYNGNGRLIYSPVRAANDYDDIRSYADAAAKAVQRAVAAGAKNATLVVIPSKKFPNSALVALLGAFEALYQPIQHRESSKYQGPKIELGFYAHGENSKGIYDVAAFLENGRFAARDLGGGDPERMAPPRFASYVKDLFHGSPIQVEIIDDVHVFEKEYPMFAAVNRAANVIERHRGRIIYLRYTGEGPIEKTLGLVGKGVTYDTGGADVKAGGIMAGMSRDKCGAANIVGYFQALAHFRPKNIKVVGVLGVVRNSIGEDCYVADEVITSRAGVRLRVGNTDAEGRMAMTDLLCHLKELLVNEVNPHLMTIATLTGHCCLAYGTYTAVMDNGPAKVSKESEKLQAEGEKYGDMIEISTIRREDYNFVKSPKDGDAELLQCNNKASSQTPRGHQFPAAFMILASGLDKHGVGSDHPIKYTHIDIAGSSGHVPDTPTGAPILALAGYTFGHLLQYSKH